MADVHLGKPKYFRKHGVPISEKVDEENLRNLENIINRFSGCTVVFLGDLFHVKHDTDAENFFTWRKKMDNSFILVKGNHDMELDYLSHNIQVYSELQYKNFLLTHIPEKTDEGIINIFGHLHPAATINTKARTYIKMPCFYIAKNGICLPAFGQFTGGKKIHLIKGEQAVLIGEGRLFPIKK